MGNTDKAMSKSLTDKHKSLIDENKSEQQSQQKSKSAHESAQLPDEIASILASPYGEDKNYLLAAISKVIVAKIFEISEAIRKAWEMFLRPPMGDEPRTSSMPFRMHVTEDIQELARKAFSTNTHSLTLDPRVEKIRQQIIELANKIQVVSQQITVNLQQAAQAQTQFIQHLQQTPSMQPLLNIFQQATQHLSSTIPPQLLHSSSGLTHQFMLDFALPTFNFHAWGDENIPNPFIHEYKATVATADPSEHAQLKQHAQSYRISIEEAVEHISILAASLGALTQLLSEIPQPKPHHYMPTGGKPTEALRGILEALGNPLPNTDDHRAAQDSLEHLLNRLKRELRIAPIPDLFKEAHSSERPEPSPRIDTSRTL